MRLNAQGWNSLALDKMPLDRDVSVDTTAIFAKRLAALRIRGMNEIVLFWISSGVKRARPSRLLSLRFANYKVMCRLMLAPTARTPRARRRQYLRDMARLAREVLDRMAARLDDDRAKRSLAKAADLIARDLAKLAAR